MFTLGLFLAAATINTAAELARATERFEPADRRFDIVVRITQTPYDNRGIFFATDKSGSIMLHSFPGGTRRLRPGDVFRFKGHTYRLANRSGLIHADCDVAEFIRHENPPPPQKVSVQDFLEGKHLFEYVSIDGIMNSVFRDEIDPDFIYFIFTCGDKRVFAEVKTTADVEAVSTRLLGAHVTVTGCCSRDADSRLYCDYFLSLNSINGILVHERHRDAPFSARDISDTASLTPQAISTLGRRRATGTVVAIWAKDKVLLKTDKAETITATLAEGILPKPGAAIEISGYPETDLYSVNLARAVWCPATAKPSPPGEAVPSSPTLLTTDAEGRPRLDVFMHAKRIVMEGEAKRIRRGRNNEFLFALEDKAASIDVIVTDEHAAAGIEEGCLLSATGVCVMEKETWRPNAIIPRITDIFLVVNESDGVHIVSRPSWWTPARLFFIIIAMAAALLAIFTWNIILRTLVARRSRQLLRAETSKADAQLRIDERTRLAAELHDSIAQTLSGVSLQIDAAERLIDGDRKSLANQLHFASGALKSCRAELRNCLWDLRNQALDEPNMNEAIRQTIAPLIGSANISINFAVRRNLISDNTAHAILRIVRELVSNAIHHGMARRIIIEGCLGAGHIRFSVQDDGCGFDPDSVPGVRQGHFGLAGIRERIRKLNGTLSIETAPTHGARITVSLEGIQHGEKQK